MDLEQNAIKRLQYGAEVAYTMYEKPLVIAYSGGKDSDVLLSLAQKADIDFSVIHSLTTVDAPPTIHHVRKVFHDLEQKGISCLVSKPQYKNQPTTMWKLIVEKCFPPTRKIRYCCYVLKESKKENSVVSTGVRWAESSRRKNNRGVIEKIASKKENSLILLNDNEESRQTFETCYQKGKSIVNPIVDWTNETIFEYIESEKIELNPLYNQGYSRVGCIGCPMAGKKRLQEFEQFPSYKKAYITAFSKMLEMRKQRQLKTANWTTGQDVFDWWIAS